MTNVCRALCNWRPIALFIDTGSNKFTATIFAAWHTLFVVRFRQRFQSFQSLAKFIEAIHCSIAMRKDTFTEPLFELDCKRHINLPYVKWTIAYNVCAMPKSRLCAICEADGMALLYDVTADSALSCGRILRH